MGNPIVDAATTAAQKLIPEAADMVTRLGTIDPAYTTGKPRVLFDGETTLTGYTETYPYINTYKPVASHRVLLLKSGSTWVIMGSPDQVGQGITIPTYPNRSDGIGRYYTNSLSVATNPSNGVTSGTVFYIPVYFASPVKIDRIGVYSTSSGPSCTIGRYLNTTSGIPGTRAISYGSISPSAAGAFEITVADTLPAGICWFGYVCPSNGNGLQVHPVANQYAAAGHTAIVNTGQTSYASESGTSLPATASSLSYVPNATVPAVWWRVSA